MRLLISHWTFNDGLSVVRFIRHEGESLKIGRYPHPTKASCRRLSRIFEAYKYNTSVVITPIHTNVSVILER